MVKGSSDSIVIHDTSDAFTRRPCSNSFSYRHNFMSGNVKDMYEKTTSKSTEDQILEYKEMDMMQVLREVKSLGSSHMNYKEKKEMMNREIVALGGKPPKNIRVPITKAKCMMKKQKERERKQLEEGLILEQFGKRGNSKNRVDKRKAEDRGLTASEGYFKDGILNVKHLLKGSSSSRSDGDKRKVSEGKKKNKGSRKRGKKKHR